MYQQQAAEEQQKKILSLKIFPRIIKTSRSTVKVGILSLFPPLSPNNYIILLFSLVKEVLGRDALHFNLKDTLLVVSEGLAQATSFSVLPVEGDTCNIFLLRSFEHHAQICYTASQIT